MAMAAPCCYSDLGKDAKELFTKGFDFGLIRLDCRIPSIANAEFKPSAWFGLESGRSAGSLACRYTWPEMGLTISERWATDGTMGGDATFAHVAQGVDVTVDTSFSPNTGRKLAVLGASICRPFARADGAVETDAFSTTLCLSGVAHQGNWFVAGAGKLGGPTGGCPEWSTSVGFRGRGAEIVAHVGDEGRLSLLVSQRRGRLFAAFTFGRALPGFIPLPGCSRDPEKIAGYGVPSEAVLSSVGAVQCTVPQFGVAARYRFSDDTSVCTKLALGGHLGFAFSQKLFEGVRLTLSSLIDLKRLNSGGHKVGIGLDMEA
uniref:voltage-dependent anion-selective channel protein 2-like n=1 Tax=Myxine glutinosa TaxID=7769 RepID=UPI00358DFA48